MGAPHGLEMAVTCGDCNIGLHGSDNWLATVLSYVGG